MDESGRIIDDSFSTVEEAEIDRSISATPPDCDRFRQIPGIFTPLGSSPSFSWLPRLGKYIPQTLLTINRVATSSSFLDTDGMEAALVEPCTPDGPMPPSPFVEDGAATDISGMSENSLWAHYEAESPDELALVKASCAYGCKLLKRKPHYVTVWMPGIYNYKFYIFISSHEVKELLCLTCFPKTPPDPCDL
jgi:hypothetical protein